MKPRMDFVRSWRKRIRAKDFKLHHENPEVFVRCQWQKGFGVSISYLIYRILHAFTFFGILISSLCDTGKNENQSSLIRAHYEVTTSDVTEFPSTGTILLEGRGKNITKPVMDTGPVFIYKWPIYLTNWGILICSIQAILAAVIVLQNKLNEKDLTLGLKTEMPLLYKIYWALNTTANVTAPTITILYWCLVYKAANGPPSAVGILVHGINSILMLTDLFLVTHPHRFQHFYFPTLLAFIYSIFTIIYYMAGGTNRHKSHKIYPQLDWDKPFTHAIPTALGSLILVLMLHFLVYGLSELRSYLGRKTQTPRCFYIGEGRENPGVIIGVNAFDSDNSNNLKDSNPPLAIMLEV